MLLALVFLGLIVELLNSAIEATVDRISFELHPLSKRAKDMGSAAQPLALCLIGRPGLGGDPDIPKDLSMLCFSHCDAPWGCRPDAPGAAAQPQADRQHAADQPSAGMR